MVFLAIIVLCFLLQMFLPWWIIIVISFATCGIIGKTGRISFWQSFIAIFCLWIGYALFKTMPNDNLLASRVAIMLKLDVWWVLVLVTGVVSGLVAGVSGFCGYHFRISIIDQKNKKI